MTVTIGAAAIAGALRTPSTAATAAPSRTLAFVTLITWLIDAGSGGYMLRTWIARGGLRRQRASDRLAPRVVFGHFGMATSGLLVWLSYLATGWIVLAWLAVGVLIPQLSRLRRPPRTLSVAGSPTRRSTGRSPTTRCSASSWRTWWPVRGPSHRERASPTRPPSSRPATGWRP
jgi:hypothetical protein